MQMAFGTIPKKESIMHDAERQVLIDLYNEVVPPDDAEGFRSFTAQEKARRRSKGSLN